MKKLFNLLLVLFLLPLFITIASAEASVDDQYCDNDVIADANQYWIINYHTVSQTFSPTKNRLTSLLLALAGGSDGQVNVNMEIYQVGGGLVATGSAQTVDTGLVSWIEYDFPAVSIDVTKQYRIDLSSTSNTARWIVSNIECYAGGYAIVDDIIKNGPAPNPYQDFGFVTYGYNYLPPSASPTPILAPSVSASPTVSPTPADIVKPISLDADYDAEDEGVRLNWSASATEGIEGYNVYRSEGDTGNYINIASVEANTNIYLDEDVVSGMTYYYTVKAYIGEMESPSSPVADVEIPLLEGEDEPILISPNKSLLETLFGQYLALGVALIVVMILGTMGLVYYLMEKRGKKKLEEKKVSSETDKEEEVEDDVEEKRDNPETKEVEKADQGEELDTEEKEEE